MTDTGTKAPSFSFAPKNATYGSLPSLAGEIGGEKTLCFLQEPTLARYIRIRETDEKNATWAALKEVRWNVDAQVAGEVSTNIEYAADGDEDTYLDLETADGGERTITLDLKEVVEVKDIFVLFGGTWGDAISAMEIYYSEDGIAYEKLGDYDGDGKFEITLDESVNARYIRLNVTSSGWVTLKEFSVNKK